MVLKFTSATLCVAVSALLACSSGNESKSGEPNSKPVNTSSEAVAPADDFSAMENQLSGDSLNIELRSVLAAKYYSVGNLNKAAYHFSLVHEMAPTNLDAVRNLGNIFYDDNKNEKAIQFYEQALAIEPNDINMRCDLATCYSRINKLKKATDILRENIKKDFNHAQSHYNLSVILEQDGKMKEAAEEMKIYRSITSGPK